MAVFRCGHPYTEQNTYYWNHPDRCAECKTCRRAKWKRKYHGNPTYKARHNAECVAWRRRNVDLANATWRRSRVGKFSAFKKYPLVYRLYWDMREQMIEDGCWPFPGRGGAA